MNNLKIIQDTKEAAMELLSWKGIDGAFMIANPSESIMFFEEKRYHDGKKFMVRTIIDCSDIIKQEWSEDDDVKVVYEFHKLEGFTALIFRESDSSVYALSTDMVIPFCNKLVGTTMMVNFQKTADEYIEDMEKSVTPKEAAHQIIDHIINTIAEGLMEDDEND